MGMGEKKVEGLLEWADFLGLLEDRSRPGSQVLTPLAQSLIELPDLPTSTPALEILYAQMVRNHPLLAQLVQQFAYNVSQQFDPSFDMQTYRDALLSIGRSFDVKPDFLLKRAPIYLDALTNPSNLGRLGLLVRVGKDRVRVNPHRPDWRVAGYLVYSSWPLNAGRVHIQELVAGRGGLGRVFLLSEGQVMGVLAKLEQEGAIALEIVADLRQIGPNPSMRAEDFLEMLLNDRN